MRKRTAGFRIRITWRLGLLIAVLVWGLGIILEVQIAAQNKRGRP